MAILAVATASNAYGTTGGTSSQINTTGANLLCVVITYVRGGGVTSSTLTDSKGNTYTPLTRYEDTSSNGSIVIYYSNSNPTVGAGHYITTNARLGTSHVIAVSGARSTSSPVDQKTGNYSGISAVTNPWNVGPITPTVDGCLVITGVCQAAAVGAPTVPSGYTLIGSFGVGTSFPGAGAYKIQTTASSETAGWGVNTSVNAEAAIADFMPPAIAAATVPNSNFLIFFC